MTSSKIIFALLGGILLLRFILLPVLPLADPTEGRYAVVAQEMCSGNDWVTPKVWIEGELIPFLGKPPLFFWLAAGAMKIFGINEFSARLPSWLGMLALLGLIHLILQRMTNREVAGKTVLLTLVCPVFFGLGGAVATDMLLAFFISGSLFVYLAFSQETEPRLRRRWSLLLFALLGGGFLTKGPVAIVLFGLPVLSWTILFRKWKLLRDHAWGWGILLFLLIVLPWFYLCELRNPGFLKYFFLHENFLRFVTHNYGDRYGTGHLYPRGSALIMFLGATLPWSPYVLWKLLRQRQHLRWKREDEVGVFLLLGFLLPTLFWCFARQLLLTYLLPTIPLFCAWFVLILPSSSEVLRRPERVVGGFLTILLLGGLVFTVFFRHHYHSTRSIVGQARKQTGKNIIFVRKIPYSAYFYAHGRIIPHPKESVEQSIERILQHPDSTLLISKNRYLKRISEKTNAKLTRLERRGAYQLLATQKHPEASEKTTEKQ